MSTIDRSRPYSLRSQPFKWVVRPKAPDTLSHAAPLQIRWEVEVQNLIVEARYLGRSIGPLGPVKRITTYIDIPQLPADIAIGSLDETARSDVRVVAVYADNGEPILAQVRWVAVRATLPAAWTDSLISTADLRLDRNYQSAEQATTEALERFMDAIAFDSSWASPTMRGALSCNLATIYAFGNKTPSPQRSSVPGESTLHDEPMFRDDELDRLYRHTARRNTIQVAWRLFRNARSLMIAKERQKEAIIEAVLSLEMGLKDALAAVATGPLRSEIRKATLNQLLTSYVPALLKADLMVTLGDSAPHIRSLIDDRNAIVHRGQKPVGDWHDLRRQIEGVRAALRWLDNSVS